jgi:two-component system NtrC family sensor kinase
VNHKPAILLIEDDLHMSTLITILLEEAGYTVTTADTAGKGLQAARSQAPDLVLLDWMLPDQPGIEVCQILKQETSHTFLPILMLTARGKLTDRVAGLDAGADDYLTKPFDSEELLARVRSLMRIRGAEIERVSALDALESKHQELQSTYNELRGTKSQLIQSAKLAALGALISGVSHELANPLMQLHTTADELQSALENNPQVQPQLETLNQNIKHIRKILYSLSTFAHYGGIKQSWQNPKELIEHVENVRRASLEALGIELSIDCPDDLPMIWADPAVMQQALLNLLINAEQALKGWPNAKIYVRAFLDTTNIGTPPLLNNYQHQPTNSGELAVVIDIADNGPGLPAKIAEHLFEPFVTTQAQGQGSGLGLSSTYGTITQHGGTLYTTTVSGQGTTFRIMLPCDVRSVSIESSNAVAEQIQ